MCPLPWCIQRSRSEARRIAHRLIRRHVRIRFPRAATRAASYGGMGRWRSRRDRDHRRLRRERPAEMNLHDRGTGLSNPVIGGDGELVIDDVHSRGYANGVSGWSIRRDGSAEFNQVLIRGTMTAQDGFDEVRISAQDPPWTNSPAVTLNPDLPTYAPGLV